MISHSSLGLPLTAGLPPEGVLVIEDDRAVQKALRRLFESVGCTVQIAGDARDGLKAFQAKQPGTVILDLRLPDLPGQDVCREIKQKAPSLPVIILSAVTDVVDKVLLLELGADDYVTKPFSPRELLARVRTASRKAQRAILAEVFSFADVTINFAKMELARGAELVLLTPHEFKLLRF